MNEKQIEDLANAIAAQAEAIAAGTHTAPRTAAAKRIRDNAETLLAWCAAAAEQG